MTPKNLEETIGYSFQKQELLKRALTHSSYANEGGRGIPDNERLEFLGDAVLELFASEFLYMEYPEKPEGEMTRLRASLVCEEALADAAKKIALGEYLSLGRGEEHTGGRERASILSDALEAVIGAIYLDGGGEEARIFIRQFVLTDIKRKELFHDSKTLLQEKVQETPGVKLSYEILDVQGPDHDRRFTAAALIDGKAAGKGTGRTKKAAEQEAAYQALLCMENRKM